MTDVTDARTDSRLIAYTAAAIYFGAMLVGAIEMAIPGGPESALLPAVAALVIGPLALFVGPRLPPRALAPLGPLGVALIGYAIAFGADLPGDAAVLYFWPIVWTCYFYGRAGTAGIVAWIGVVHLGALSQLPESHQYLDRWFDVVASAAIVGFVVCWLSERNAKLVQRLLRESRVDSLTGLLNRRGFDQRLSRELDRAARDGSSLAAVSFDVDHFKQINDVHGHEIGDRVLAWLGRTLAEQSRTVDIAARIGGEEFVVVLPHTDLPGALAFSERVRCTIETPFGRPEFGIPDGVDVTISGGLAVGQGPLDGPSLLARADGALYAAKHAGRNRIRVHTPKSLSPFV